MHPAMALPQSAGTGRNPPARSGPLQNVGGAARLSLDSWFRMYCRIVSSSRPTADTKDFAPGQFRPTKFCFRSLYVRARWIASLVLMQPVACDASYFGGIAISTGTWSASIRLSFCRADRRSTSLRGCSSWPTSALRRHFEMKTTWYLHSPGEWSRLPGRIGGTPLAVRERVRRGDAT